MRAAVYSFKWLHLSKLIFIMVAIFTTTLFLAPGASATTKYVALGDSFASGYGADSNQYQGEHMNEYDPATIIPDKNKCYRAWNNAYAPIVAKQKGYTLTFTACQEATTAEILTKSQYPQQPPQIQAVTADTNRVSLQIGGNDAQFFPVVTCMVTTNCTASSPAYAQGMSIIQNQLPARLDAVYAAIKQRAPQAKIAAIDYAPILPQTYSEALLCKPYITPAELQLAHVYRNSLNQAVKAAADRAGAAYVNTDYPTSPFYGRDWVGLSKNACSPSAGSISWSLRLLTNGENVSFHPTAYGHQFYAQILKNYL